MGSASPHVRRMAATDTTMVSQSRSPITSETGRCHSSAIPKFPRTTSFIQRRYWTHMGLLRPYCSRRASASCSVTKLPEADICAT